tara:strand:- start:422 stop:1810 length:1389 start_codon:yes stop_codon:yes gene_type:complete
MKENKIKCYTCSIEIEEIDSIAFDGAFYCEPCYDEIEECDKCGEKEYEFSEVDNESWCSSCVDSYAYSCDNCGDYDHIDHSYSASDGYNIYCEDCYSELYGYCYSCDSSYLHEELIYSNDSYYCEDCHNTSGTEIIDSAPTSYQGNSIDNGKFEKVNIKRLVGMEAECVYKDSSRILRAPTGWNMTSDSSISSSGDYSGIEWVSIPSRGDAIHDILTDLNTWAKDNMAHVNKSCGFHVHIDATDLDWKDLVSIAIVTQKLENYIYAMLPKSRREVSWSKPIRISKDFLKSVKSHEDFISEWYTSLDSSPSNDKYNDARYTGLNLHARYYLGTIEFRYHSGTLNLKKMLNWVKICNSIVETGIKLNRDSEWSGREFFMSDDLYTVNDVLDKMENLDDGVKGYMVERIQLFEDDANEEGASIIDDIQPSHAVGELIYDLGLGENMGATIDTSEAGYQVPYESIS